jgi:GT2 family glycosyltransferase
MIPRLSVITVTLNAEEYLAECLASVASQDALHEHIIVDGGSTDATIELIRRHATGFPRLRWTSEPDLGISDAMNKGARLATGEVIAHLNADDYYPHTKVLSAVLDCFSRNPQGLWLTGGLTFVSENGSVIKDVRVRRYSFRRLVRNNILFHPSTFVNRALFNAVGGFRLSLSYCMDYDLFLRLGSIAQPMILDKQLCCFRVHAGSRSFSQAEQSYAEEYSVRMDFLRSRGLSTIYYYFDYQIKKRLHKLFCRRLARNSSRAGK